MKSSKKLRCMLIGALTTSAVLGPALVWLVASYGHGFDDDLITTKLRTDALAREDRSFFNSRGVLHANSIILTQDQKSIIRRNSVSTTAPRRSNYEWVKFNMNSPDNTTNSTINAPIKQPLTAESTLGMENCLWANRTIPKSHYFLTAVVLLRIYKEDKANLTTRELKQWLEYMRYIGVEHVYLYDAFVSEDEAQMNEVKMFLQDNYVTYIDWHVHNPYTISGTQVSAYQHCINHFGHENTWQAAIDIDEYPFSPVDTRPGFLSRFIKRFSEKDPTASEICMQNFLFLGKPLPLELLMERIWRRTPQPSNPLVKPIYKPANVRAQVHHNNVMQGHTTNAPAVELRMNHYWGARLQNWGEDTPEIIAKTVEDRSMEDIVKTFKQCEPYVRPYLR